MARKSLRLDDLFRVVAEVELYGKPLFLRVLSDFDLQARDEASLLASAEARLQMLQPDTKLHRAHLAWLQSATVEQLRNVILGAETASLVRASFLEVPPQLYPFPDEATEEEKAEIIGKRKAEEDRVAEARKEFVKKGLEAAQKRLDEEGSPEKLLAQARERQLETQSRAEAMAAFDRYTLFASTFKDKECRERYFASPEAVADLAPAARQTLLRHYYEDVDRVSAQDLQYFFSTDGSPES